MMSFCLPNTLSISTWRDSACSGRYELKLGCAFEYAQGGFGECRLAWDIGRLAWSIGCKPLHLHLAGLGLAISPIAGWCKGWVAVGAYRLMRGSSSVLVPYLVGVVRSLVLYCTVQFPLFLDLKSFDSVS